MVLVGGCSVSREGAAPVVWPVWPTVGPEPASLLLVLHGPACAMLAEKAIATQVVKIKFTILMTGSPLIGTLPTGLEN
jgi:hypothetical protein